MDRVRLNKMSEIYMQILILTLILILIVMQYVNNNTILHYLIFTTSFSLSINQDLYPYLLNQLLVIAKLS